MSILISLGSNLGERIVFLDRACEMIDSHPAISVERESETFETTPVDLNEQSDFLNRVAEIKTDLGPFALLTLLQKIEDSLGRERIEENGPRTIDLDLLTYGNWILNTPELVLPHPRMHLRRFVLVPLLQLQGNLTDPRTETEYSSYLNGIDAKEQGVREYGGQQV